MGMLMSYLGAEEGIVSIIKGEGTAYENIGEKIAMEALTGVLGTLHAQFLEKDIKDFESFHYAILEMFNKVNAALPGEHYGPPSHEIVLELQDLFDKLKTADNKQKKLHFTEFMKKHVNPGKVERFMMVTPGFLAPPAAMAAKRTSKVLPQLRFISSIPDIIFVPAATIMVLAAFKFSRLNLTKKALEKQPPEESK